ncbi:hypothetical protein NDU88_005582 [Pleurodeles waltl]|uniref:Uncharacterized protein n=1 Tax=Pleurodeles waltl TaxID=8319 RepID=A0AAV7N6A7_PLEWA|nr:hypothetical protein NDU88_005582 [Pleurodeles waltl]
MVKSSKKREAAVEDQMMGSQSSDIETQDDHTDIEKTHPTPTLQDVLQAIAAFRQALELKIDARSKDPGL